MTLIMTLFRFVLFPPFSFFYFLYSKNCNLSKEIRYAGWKSLTLVIFFKSSFSKRTSSGSWSTCLHRMEFPWDATKAKLEDDPLFCSKGREMGCWGRGGELCRGERERSYLKAIFFRAWSKHFREHVSERPLKLVCATVLIFWYLSSYHQF